MAMKVSRQMVRKLNILMEEKDEKNSILRFSQDWLPSGGAHGEGSDEVGGDLYQGD